MDWRPLLPEGFSVHQLDEHILEDDALEIPDHLRLWVKMNWGTKESYLKHGFGTCIVHESSIVSYSLADCVHGDECEIGIQTLERFRRRGLATVTAAANIDLAFDRGFEVVGWHTHDYNEASQKTAEKVGFELERRYLQYECHRVEAMHIAEAGLRFFLRGEHEAAVQIFDEALQTGGVEAWVYSLAARSYALLGNISRALGLLRMALDHGWSNVGSMKENVDFDSLRSLPEWDALVAEAESNMRKTS